MPLPVQRHTRLHVGPRQSSTCAPASTRRYRTRIDDGSPSTAEPPPPTHRRFRRTDRPRTEAGTPLWIPLPRATRINLRGMLREGSGSSIRNPRAEAFCSGRLCIDRHETGADGAAGRRRARNRSRERCHTRDTYHAENHASSPVGIRRCLSDSPGFLTARRRYQRNMNTPVPHTLLRREPAAGSHPNE